MTVSKYACAVVKPTTGVGVGVGTGLLSDASSIVWLSSSELSSNKLADNLACMHHTCRAYQPFARAAILCFCTDGGHFIVEV